LTGTLLVLMLCRQAIAQEIVAVVALNALRVDWLPKALTDF
jgi:hypothetical protein